MENQDSSLARFVKKLDRTLQISEDTVCVIALTAMAAMTLFAVVARYILHLPLTWLEESCRYLNVAITYIGVSIVTRERSHLGLSMLVESLPGRAARVCKFLGDTIVLFVICWLVTMSFSLVSKAHRFGQISVGTKLPIWVVYLLLLAGFILAGLRQLMLMYNDYFAKEKVIDSGGGGAHAN